ncbi:MAG: fatty acid desaturase [Polyangiales bacterium]
MTAASLSDCSLPDQDVPATAAPTPAARDGKELIEASRAFAVEDLSRSVTASVTTVAVLLAALAGAVALPWWPARIASMVVAGLTIVRAFILYHDVMHGALFRGPSLTARVGRGFFTAFGVWVLTPPKVWKQTHNYHHAHTAKLVGSHVGSYLMLTPEMYKKATPAQRAVYRFMRHPLNMAMGYLTVFLWGMCLGPFLRAPRKLWDSLLAFVLHAAIVTAVWVTLGPTAVLTGVVGPYVIAFALGAYLFYAQHNFPGIKVQPRESWSYTRAALESSSYLKTGPVMGWFTGNIGYHHVHHLNPTIPFYRLPEAMAAIPELQNPHTTSLAPRDVLACFELKLWDPAQGRMVGYEAVAD